MTLDPARAHLRRDLFGGRGEVRVWNLGGQVPPFTAVLWCQLEAGGHVGAHRQETDDELVIVVSGRATVHVDGTPHARGAGGSVGLRLGALLAIGNDDPGAALDYLIVKARRASPLPGT